MEDEERKRQIGKVECRKCGHAWIGHPDALCPFCEIKRLRAIVNQAGVIERKKNRDVLQALGQMSGNPDEYYIPPVTLAKRARKAEDTVRNLKAEIKRLREADQYPTTKDGVRVVPGMTVWWTLHGTLYDDLVLSVSRICVLIIPRHGPDFGRQVALLFSDCYSTRGAAEAGEK